MPSTTLKSIELTCPNCGNEFTSQAVQDADSVKGARRTQTDFRTKSEGIEVLRYGVHQCQRCGFAGREEGFSPSGTVSYEVQQHVWGELAPFISANEAPMSEKYECAAKIATWDGFEATHVADLWLRAAWCCVEEGDVEAERFYRRHAAWSYEEGLGTFDQIGPDERVKIVYLVGELWRRIGDRKRATTWFDRVAEEANAARDQIWVHWAERQQLNPSEWFV